MSDHALKVLGASLQGVVFGLISIAAAVRGDRSQSTLFTVFAVLIELAVVLSA